MSSPATKPEAVAVETTTFYSVRDGAPYTTSDPSEITRMRMSRNFSETQDVPAEIDQQFHPGDHTVSEVIQHLAEHPEQVDRVVAEERKGQNRKTITGEA
jgi:hypothetical protein